MDDLIAFLRAQLDADLRVARAALVHEGRDREHSEPLDWQRHVWGWKPSRVLVEVEAKRRLLDYAIGCPVCGEHGVIAHACSGVRAWDALDMDEPMDTWRRVVLLLAQPYADRPGFKPEWRLTCRS